MSLWGNVVGGVGGFLMGGPIGAVIGSVAGGAIDDSGIIRDVKRVCPHCGTVHTWKAIDYNSNLVGKTIICSVCRKSFWLGNEQG